MSPIESPELDFTPRRTAGNPANIQQDVKKAQEELQRLQQEQAEIERRRQELNLLNEKKHEFVVKQAEISELFSKSLTELEREIAGMRGETTDLEKIRECFRNHLIQTESMDPEKWNQAVTPDKLDSAMDTLNELVTDYKEAALHCAKNMTRTKMFEHHKVANGAFIEDSTKKAFLQGLAFNLPLVILGTIALIIFILK